MPKLSISLVPRTSWFTNLRSILPPKKWDELRKSVYLRANYRCEICQGQGSRHPVECHEKWAYNEETKIQRLTGLIALCPACHEVVHIGLAQLRGRYQQALHHLAKVNDWSLEKAERYVQLKFEVWQRRSESEWTVDVSWLDHDVKIDQEVKHDKD